MSIETKIIIICNRCGKKSTSDNYKQFCSKVNCPCPDHFNNFEIEMFKHIDKTGIFGFGINVKIDDKIDLCLKCRKWVNEFFNKQADKIKALLEQEWKKK